MAVCAPVSSRNYYGIASQAHLRREDSRYALVAALERLYLVAALALLYATTQECLCKSLACAPLVDHWRRR